MITKPVDVNVCFLLHSSMQSCSIPPFIWRVSGVRTWYGFKINSSKTLLISDGYKHVCPFCGFERENYMHAMCGARGCILQYDSKFLYRDSGTLRMHGSLSCVGTMCCVLRAYGASAHARLMDATRSSRCYVWYSHASIHLAIQNASSSSVIARSTQRSCLRSRCPMA